MNNKGNAYDLQKKYDLNAKVMQPIISLHGYHTECFILP